MLPLDTTAIILALLCCSVQALPDWLVTDIKIPVQVTKQGSDLLRMSNGLVTRTFLLNPGFVTMDLYSHEKNSSVLRAIDPEVELLR